MAAGTWRNCLGNSSKRVPSVSPRRDDLPVHRPNYVGPTRVWSFVLQLCPRVLYVCIDPFLPTDVCSPSNHAVFTLLSSAQGAGINQCSRSKYQGKRNDLFRPDHFAIRVLGRSYCIAELVDRME